LIGIGKGSRAFWRPNALDDLDRDAHIGQRSKSGLERSTTGHGAERARALRRAAAVTVET
jgi:hypothetical protein